MAKRVFSPCALTGLLLQRLVNQDQPLENPLPHSLNQTNQVAVLFVLTAEDSLQNDFVLRTVDFVSHLIKTGSGHGKCGQAVLHSQCASLLLTKLQEQKLFYWIFMSFLHKYDNKAYSFHPHPLNVTCQCHFKYRIMYQCKSIKLHLL